MLIKVNLLIKLKLLRLYIKFLIKNNYFLNTYFNPLNTLFVYNILNNLNQRYSLANTYGLNLANRPLNLSLKKLKLFKINYLNNFLMYNIVNLNFKLKNNLINLDSVSNYNFSYLFIYYNYFIKDTKLGMSKYFNNYYQNNLFFVKFFILKYLKSYLTHNNFYLGLHKNNIDILEHKTLYNVLVKKTRYLKFLKEIGFQIKSFLNLILICLYNKDIVLFKNGIKNILEKLHFKKHRRFLYSLKLVLKLLSYVFFYKFKCLGLYIKVKGKIGVGGNLKKRKFIYKVGSFSFTKKLQKMNYTKDSIRTYSGVLGFEAYLTYK